MNTPLNENAGKLLIVVMEKHKCDAAMAAARNAGAPGGTVLLGRGTATTGNRSSSPRVCPLWRSAPS